MNAQLEAVKLQIMIITAIKTRAFIPPKDDLFQVLSESITSLKENSIVAITSKVVAIGEGNCIKIEEIEKDELIKKEADKYLPRELVPGALVMYTLKNNILVASAGIDESNGDGYYILWPKDPNKSAKEICLFFFDKFKIQNLGVIITDSRLVPLRQGVVGISIGYFGFKPIKDYRGKKDIFGREFKMETSNIPDSLASAAVLEMGEGSEMQPVAVISDISNIEFLDKQYQPEDPGDSFDIDPEIDVFSPFLNSVKWEKGKKS